MTKLGINIHPVYTQSNKQTRAYSAEEKTALDAFLLQAQPSTITVLNDFGWALRFSAMLPNTKVSFRKQHDRDGDYWTLTNADGTPYTPRQHFEGTKEHQRTNIRLHLSNEPMGKTMYADDGTPQYTAIAATINWHVGCMDLFGAAGIPLVVMNWGVGLPDIQWFKATAPEWSLIRPLFEAFKRWPLHTLGMHVYWRKDGFLEDDFVNRPRDVHDALKALGYDVRMQITEYGSDAIGGHPGPWMDAYGDTDAGQKEYVRLLVKGQRENLNLPYIDGIDTYSWAGYPRWPRYDISKAQLIQDTIISSNLNVPTPAPVPVPDPPPPPPPPPVPEPEPPPLPYAETLAEFCDNQIRALTLQIEGLERLKASLESAAQSKAA
jgi:hypothetical protein